MLEKIMKYKRLIIVAVVVILCVIVGCVAINKHNSTKYKSIYESFIEEGKYKKEVTDTEGIELSYTLYDLNSDKVDELIINASEGNFETNYIYTYKDGEIKFIDKKYHYGKLSYNTQDKGIIFSEMRPSNAYGWIYTVYSFDGDKLTDTVGYLVTISPESTKYQRLSSEGTTDISEDDYKAAMNNNQELERTEIK
ncbi:MAG: hypothetical protein K6C11_00430 [Bacilli bacterium]|nr:hypothetical protein [Bacilli bacterium]